MGFRSWLRKQARREDRVGDLARDANEDSAFPSRGTKERWELHLFSMGADSNCMDAFDAAWGEFEVAA